MGRFGFPKKELERINAERAQSGSRFCEYEENAAAGSLRQLDPKVTSGRKLNSFLGALERMGAEEKMEDEDRSSARGKRETGE